MSISPIQSFVIDHESIANSYMRDLLAKPECRSMDEIRMRADKYIPDADLKNCFINEGEKRLRALAR
jgi:hypothetical protein